MSIYITIEVEEEKIDIGIDKEQKIGQVIGILKETGKLVSKTKPTYFRSLLNQKLVCVGKTFEEEGIYDGDTLKVVN